jgi:hypothetical protein
MDIDKNVRVLFTATNPNLEEFNNSTPLWYCKQFQHDSFSMIYTNNSNIMDILGL